MDHRSRIGSAGHHWNIMASPRIRSRSVVTSSPAKSSAPSPSRSKMSQEARRRSTGSSQPATDRVGMLIMEANEISECLHKDYTFSRIEELGSEEALVKVTNRRVGISATWTLTKLKERLMQMRKLMYASEGVSDGMASESVFFDPDDTWTREAGPRVNGQKNPPPMKEKATPPVSTNRSQFGAMALNKSEMDRNLLNAIFLEKLRRPYFVQRSLESVDLSRPIRPVPITTDRHLDSSFNGLSTLSSTTSSELPAETEFLQVSGHLEETQRTNPSTSSSSLVLPEKYLVGGHEEAEIPNYHHRPTGTVTPIRDVSACRDTGRNLKRKPALDQCINTVHTGCQTDEIDTPRKNTTPMLSLCKEMANMVLQRTQDGKHKATAVDVIMRSCESVKVAVINILEAFTEAQLNGTMESDQFADCDLVRVSSIQLVSALDLLVTNATNWAESFTDVQSDLISDLSSTIIDTVKELAAEQLAFLQGCENDDESTVQDTSSKVIEHLFSLVKCCGELALANEICPNDSLIDTQDLTYDVTQIQPSDDMKQSLLDGCDSFLEGTTQSCLNRILECEDTLETLVEICRNQGSEAQKDILKHVYIIIATVKMLLESCQKVQTDLNSLMKNGDGKPNNYYLHYFHRNLSLVSEFNNLLDGSTLLIQATQPFTQDEDGAVLRKIYRCTEMVQRAIPKLVAGSVGDIVVESTAVECVASNVHASCSSQSENISAGVLFDPQTQTVMAASQEVTLATHALNGLIRKMLPSQNKAASRVKRMLPATPGRGLVRCHSARSLDKARISRSLASFDFTHQ